MHEARARRALLHLLPAALAATAVGSAAAQPRARAELLGAIRRDDPHALRNALLRGADANSVDEFGDPVIVVAARSSSWEAVRALAELRGTELDATGPSGANALMFAALHGRLELVRFMVSRGAEVNKTGWTPLHYAAANGHRDVVRFLLESHAYIDAESPNRTTPLMMAARQAHPSTVQLLLDEGADPTPRNEAGLDAATYAKASGQGALAESLARQADAFRRRYGLPPSGR